MNSNLKQLRKNHWIFNGVATESEKEKNKVKIEGLQEKSNQIFFFLENIKCEN